MIKSDKEKFIHVLGYHGGVTGLSCRGDSGGPLVEFNSKDEYYVQVGIVAGGACNSSTEPAIFARIEDYQIFEFITKQFWNNALDGKEKFYFYLPLNGKGV